LIPKKVANERMNTNANADITPRICANSWCSEPE